MVQRHDGTSEERTNVVRETKNRGDSLGDESCNGGYVVVSTKDDSFGYKSCNGGYVVMSDSDDLLGDVSCNNCYVVVSF